METETSASLDAASAQAGGSSISSEAKQAFDANSVPAVAADDLDANDGSNAPSSRPTAQPQAPQTPSVAPGVKQGSIITVSERERAAREVLQALTASSSLAHSSVKAASRGGSGGAATAAAAMPMACCAARFVAPSGCDGCTPS